MKQESEIKNILILIAFGVGDTISATPAFYALRKKYPNDKITLATTKNILEIIADKKCYDYILDVNCMDDIFDNDEASISFFKKFDLIIHNTILTNISENIKKSGVLCFDLYFGRKMPISINAYTPIELAFKLIEPIKNAPISCVPKIFLTEEDEIFAENFLTRNNINVKKDIIITMQVGSGIKKRRWFFDRYVSITKWLIKKYDAKILAISGPRDDSLGDILKAEIGSNSVVVAKNLNLRELASIISKTSFYLGNDCGISHLSAAVGVPSIVIFGNEDPDYRAPRGAFHIQLSDRSSYRNCGNERKERCTNQKCFDSIKVEDVKEAVKCLFRNLNIYKNAKYVMLAPNIKIKKKNKDGAFFCRENLGILYFKRGAVYVGKILNFIADNGLLSVIKNKFPEDEELLKLLMEKEVIFLSLKKGAKNLFKSPKIHRNISNKIGALLLAALNYEVYCFLNKPRNVEYSKIKNYDSYSTPCMAGGTQRECPHYYTGIFYR